MHCIQLHPGCIPRKPHTRGTPVAPQVYTNVEGWHTLEVPLCQCAKGNNLGYIHTTTLTGKLTPYWRSLGLSA